MTVEKFPGVETASRLVQFESVSTKIMATMVHYKKFTTINVLFSSQYFICLDEISSDSSLFKCGQPNTFKSLFIAYMLQSIDKVTSCGFQTPAVVLYCPPHSLKPTQVTHQNHMALQVDFQSFSPVRGTYGASTTCDVVVVLVYLIRS